MDEKHPLLTNRCQGGMFLQVRLQYQGSNSWESSYVNASWFAMNCIWRKKEIPLDKRGELEKGKKPI